MKMILGLLLLGSCFGQTCGIERHPVKTMADLDVRFINDGGQVKITELTAHSAPTKKELLKANATRFPAEKFSVVVIGRLVGFKLETDGDFHIVLQDLVDPKTTMIVEIPNPSCVPQQLQAKTEILRAEFQSKFGKATPRFKRVKNLPVIRVTGPVFYDFLHRQTGVATNGVEIHPVTDLQVP